MHHDPAPPSAFATECPRFGSSNTSVARARDRPTNSGGGPEARDAAATVKSGVFFETGIPVGGRKEAEDRAKYKAQVDEAKKAREAQAAAPSKPS